MVLDRPGFLRRWSDLHEGIDPGSLPFVRRWLSLTFTLARPIAEGGVAPWAVTLLGLAAAGGVPCVAIAGGRWPVLAAGLVLASGLLDGLDGPVAVLTDRVTSWGAWLDAVCDRLADAAYGVALWVLGAPAWLAVLWVGLGLLSEYARARAQALLSGPLDVVSVGERPTRVIVAVVPLLAGGLVPSRASDAALVGAGIGAATAAVGLVQVVLAVRRRLV